MSAKRVGIKAILRNPAQRRTLLVNCIIATQAREGVTTTREQAEAAYDKVVASRKGGMSVNHRLRIFGARDAREGKPVEAFYKVRLAPSMRHTETLRAAYEIGYRAEKQAMREEQRAKE
jgi:hypothetical protein